MVDYTRRDWDKAHPIKAAINRIYDFGMWKEGGKLKSRHVFLFETLIIVPFVPVWIKLKLTTKAFYVKDSCLGCGKCAKVCPLNNINIVENKPEWGKKCTHCMACICNCPKDSIEYGTITVGKERYLFKKFI